jgi:hypothetical protein
MAAPVEVLQVERVVPGLFDVRRQVLRRAHLELEGDQRAASHHDGVDPAAEPRDVKLKEEVACDASERRAQEHNFVRPCPDLSGFYRSTARLREDSHDLVDGGREEGLD